QLRKRVTAYRQEVAAHCAAHGRPGAAAILDDRYLTELLQVDEPARDVALWACGRDRGRCMLRLTASAGRATTRRRAAGRRAARELIARIDQAARTRSNPPSDQQPAPGRPARGGGAYPQSRHPMPEYTVPLPNSAETRITVS